MALSHALKHLSGRQKQSLRILNLSFQIGLVCVLTWVLYAELYERDNLAVIWAEFLNALAAAPTLYLWTTLALLPFNWLMEAIKWRYFMKRYQPITLGRALKAVFAGVFFALVTPNRIGELGGRLLFVKRINLINSMLANVLGSVAQYLVSLLAGLVGAWVLADRLFVISPGWKLWLFGMATLGLALIYFLFFNSRIFLPFIDWICSNKYLKPLRQKLGLLDGLSLRDLVYLYAWSLCRYAIYATQYYCMLCFMGIQPGILNAYCGIFFIFFIQTILPIPAVAGLLARGNLAVWVWGIFGANEISALAATFTLWIINLILPALIGTFLLFSVHITKTIGYEAE